MKRNRLFYSLLILLTVILALTLCSCNLLSNTNNDNYDSDEESNPDMAGVGISSSYINEKGELIFVYTDGSVQNLGVIVGNDGESGSSGSTNITINGGGSIDSLAVSKALRSAVSIFCEYDSITSSYTSAGAGVIYKLDKSTGSAFIITNYHVVYDDTNGISDNINLLFYGSEYASYLVPATFIGGSPNYDIAVLYVGNSELLKNSAYEAIEKADSNKVYVGETALAVGNPNSDGISASSGIVSVDSENIYLDIGGTVSIRVMRIDTPVNSGNSGGGLYNHEGKLIGIVNAKTSDSALDNISYAVPSNIACNVADNIIDNCFGTSLKSVQRVLFGITITADKSYAVLTDDGHITTKETIIVSDVSYGGLADGQLKKKDILKSIKVADNDELEISRQFHVIDEMLKARVGDTVTFKIIRDGIEMEISFVITRAAVTSY